MTTYISSWTKKRNFSPATKFIRDEFNIPLLHNDDPLPEDATLIINWGNSSNKIGWLEQAEHNNIPIINHPYSGDLAVNKLKTLTTLQKANVPVIPFTTSKDEAYKWFVPLDYQEHASIVYAREKTNGRRGEGVIVCDPTEMGHLPDAKFYTKHLRGREFRVIIFEDQTSVYLQKKRRNGWKDNEHYNNRIKNLKNGWVYCADNVYVRCRQQALDAALGALITLELDFAGIDIIYNEGNDDLRILEVNTAPGVKHRATREAFLNYFRRTI